MVTTANSSTLITPPSAAAAAASGNSSMDDSPNSATLVAMILLGAAFIAVVIALLIYRYYRRTSGPVWISKVFRFITCRRCTFRDTYSDSLICMQDCKQSRLLCYSVKKGLTFVQDSFKVRFTPDQPSNRNKQTSKQKQNAAKTHSNCQIYFGALRTLTCRHWPRRSSVKVCLCNFPTVVNYQTAYIVVFFFIWMSPTGRFFLCFSTLMCFLPIPSPHQLPYSATSPSSFLPLPPLPRLENFRWQMLFSSNRFLSFCENNNDGYVYV